MKFETYGKHIMLEDASGRGLLIPSNGFLVRYEELLREKDMLNILCISHDDADGYASSAIIKEGFENVILEYDYNGDYTDFGTFSLKEHYGSTVTVINTGDYYADMSQYKTEIRKADIVFVCDLSFKQEQIDYITEQANLFVWIDHHKTSLEVENKDDRTLFKMVWSEPGISAAALCWLFINKWFYGFATEGNACIEDDAYYTPSIIKHVSLYDTFHPDAVNEFSYGLHTVDMTKPEFWNKLLAPTLRYVVMREHKQLIHYCSEMRDYNLPFQCGSVYVDNVILRNGAAAKKWAEDYYEMARKECLVDCFIKIRYKDMDKEKFVIYHIAVMNCHGNSFMFGPEYYNYDAVVKYTINKNFEYKYSMYSNRNPKGDSPLIDCSVVAKSFGGGGHAGACGWRSDHNLIKEWVEQNEKGIIPLFDENEINNK